MSTAASTHSAQELVPLQERLRWFWLFRLVAVVTVPVFSVLLGGLLVGVATIAAVTAGYLVLSGLIELAWRRAQQRLLGVFAAILILDALYLAFIAYAAGDALNPLRYLTVVHLVVVALLASYRTGLKLALWHSVLALGVYHARDNGYFDAAPLPADGSVPYRSLIAFVLLFWLVALATATFSAVNERELRRRRYDLEALAAFSDAVESAQSPEEVAQALLQHLGDAFDFQRSAVLAGPRDTLGLLASTGTVGRPATAYLDAEGSVVRSVLDARRVALVEGLDPQADPWLATVLPSLGNVIVMPLTSDARAFGVVVLEHSLVPGSRVERRVLDMTERFTAHASLALENAFLLEQLRRSASTDGLTGIANRRSFDVTLDRYLARAVAGFEPVSLVLLDIDHFKRLNDDHGHQVGDDVLRQVAAVLLEQARTIDVPARYGGEEFAVVLPECGEEEAWLVADRLRQALASAGTARPITVSAGVATFPDQGATADALIRAADDALYRAKAAGRNRVMSAEPVRVGEL